MSAQRRPRPRRIPLERLDVAVALARTLTQVEVQERTGISAKTISKEIRARGLSPRRFQFSRRYPQELFERAALLAGATTINNAERATGLSAATIRKEMRVRGIPRRRSGAPTMAEVERMGALLVA